MQEDILLDTLNKTATQTAELIIRAPSLLKEITLIFNTNSDNIIHNPMPALPPFLVWHGKYPNQVVTHQVH